MEGGGGGEVGVLQIKPFLVRHTNVCSVREGMRVEGHESVQVLSSYEATWVSEKGLMLLESLVKATVELQEFWVVTVMGEAGGLVAKLVPDRRALRQQYEINPRKRHGSQGPPIYPGRSEFPSSVP